MKLENQVCSLSLSEMLKELKVKQESCFYWAKLTDGVSLVYQASGDTFNVVDALAVYVTRRSIQCSAFTVAELGEMLPDYYETRRVGKVWSCYDKGESSLISGETEANVRATMLTHLIREGIVKV